MLVIVNSQGSTGNDQLRIALNSNFIVYCCCSALQSITIGIYFLTSRSTSRSDTCSSLISESNVNVLLRFWKIRVIYNIPSQRSRISITIHLLCAISLNSQRELFDDKAGTLCSRDLTRIVFSSCFSCNANIVRTSIFYVCSSSCVSSTIMESDVTLRLVYGNPLSAILCPVLKGPGNT